MNWRWVFVIGLDVYAESNSGLLACYVSMSGLYRCNFAQTLHDFYFFFLMIPRPPNFTLFPYTTLFRSSWFSRWNNKWKKCNRTFFWWQSFIGSWNAHTQIGRAHVWTPVTTTSRMPSSAWKTQKKMEDYSSFHILTQLSTSNDQSIIIDNNNWSILVNITLTT